MSPNNLSHSGSMKIFEMMMMSVYLRDVVIYVRFKKSEPELFWACRKVNEWNRRIVDLTGYSKQEAIGQDLLSVYFVSSKSRDSAFAGQCANAIPLFLPSSSTTSQMFSSM